MTQKEQSGHVNGEANESVTFVSVRADSTAGAISQAIDKLMDEDMFTSFDVVHAEGDGIHVVRASHEVPEYM